MMQDVGILGFASAFFLKKMLMRDFDSERYIGEKTKKDCREKWKFLWREMTSDLNSRIGTEYSFKKKARRKTNALL